LFRVSGKAESQRAGSSDPESRTPWSGASEPLRCKPAMKAFVGRGALQALRDLHTNPSCDSTQISGLQTRE